MNDIYIELDLDLESLVDDSPVITEFDPYDGIIYGRNFKNGYYIETGEVLLFNRHTNSYEYCGYDSWSDTEIHIGEYWHDGRDGDSAIKVVTKVGHRQESKGYSVKYPNSFPYYCRITYRDVSDNSIRQAYIEERTYENIIEANNHYGVIRSHGQDVYLLSQMLGIEFGDQFEKDRISSGFLDSCLLFNQPLRMPDSVEYIESYFLFYCFSFDQPIYFPEGLEEIGGYFMGACYSFNHPLTFPYYLNHIGYLMLADCSAFNSDIEFGQYLETIGFGFMAGCFSFNKNMSLPDYIYSIESSFMSGCSSFNSPLRLPEGIYSIDDNFLYSCCSFNQRLVISEYVGYIGSYFMQDCHAFNKPLELPNNVTEITDGFMCNCYSFNSRLKLPDYLWRIGYSFFENCYAYNQELNLPYSLNEIWDYFMNSCYSYSHRLVLPGSMGWIGEFFMFECYLFLELEVESTFTPPGDPYTLSTARDSLAPAYLIGVRLYGPGAHMWTYYLNNQGGWLYRKLIHMGD